MMVQCCSGTGALLRDVKEIHFRNEKNFFYKSWIICNSEQSGVADCELSLTNHTEKSNRKFNHPHLKPNDYRWHTQALYRSLYRTVFLRIAFSRVVHSEKKGTFQNPPERFGRWQKASWWVKMSKETIKKIYETLKGSSPGYRGRTFATKPF